MVAASPELPDDTPIERVILFSTRIQNALRAADLKIVGEVREISDETLISLPDFGKGSRSELREKLGCRRPMGSGPWAKSQPNLPIDNFPPSAFGCLSVFAPRREASS
jgi:hypothetical protein